MSTIQYIMNDISIYEKTMEQEVAFCFLRWKISLQIWAIESNEKVTYQIEYSY